MSEVPTLGKVVNDDGDVSADVTRNDDAAIVVTDGDEVTCNDVDVVKPDDEAELVGAGTCNTLLPVLFLDGGVGVICTPPIEAGTPGALLFNNDALSFENTDDDDDDDGDNDGDDDDDAKIYNM